MLHERKGLPKEQFINIWNNKQKYTLEALSNLKKDKILYSTIQNLSLHSAKATKLLTCLIIIFSG